MYVFISIRLSASVSIYSLLLSGITSKQLGVDMTVGRCAVFSHLGVTNEFCLWGKGSFYCEHATLSILDMATRCPAPCTKYISTDVFTHNVPCVDTEQHETYH